MARMISAIGYIEDDLIADAIARYTESFVAASEGKHDASSEEKHGTVGEEKQASHAAKKNAAGLDSHAAKKNAAGQASTVARGNAAWLKWSAAVACLALLIVAGIMILPTAFGKKPQQTMGNVRYRNFSLQAQGETAILWPWEYRTIGEKYRTIVMNGMEYCNTDHKVSESMLGKMVGTFEVSGYDEYKEESHVISAEAYELNDVEASISLAVKLEDGYYVFRNMECLPAGTLGELLDQVNLSKFLRLNWFEERGSDPKGKRYVLNDGSYLWKVLTEECRDAKFIDDQNWMMGKREYLGFSVSSNVLGVQNVALYVTKDGYLWTNVFGPQYLYDIGEEAAGKVIWYCKANANEIEAQPFSNAVIGTITEITEDYFLVDDSSLCKDPKDGITYKVLLNDLRISRYVQMNLIKAGDMVEVLYRGQMDEENDHAIREATYASKVTIIDGEALIFE